MKTKPNQTRPTQLYTLHTSTINIVCCVGRVKIQIETKKVGELPIYGQQSLTLRLSGKGPSLEMLDLAF